MPDSGKKQNHELRISDPRMYRKRRHGIRALLFIVICLWLFFFGVNRLLLFWEKFESVWTQAFDKTAPAPTVQDTAVQPQDSDNDGLSDTEEAHYGTNPLRTDSDGDGFSDLIEVRKDFDPLDASK